MRNRTVDGWLLPSGDEEIYAAPGEFTGPLQMSAAQQAAWATLIEKFERQEIERDC